MCTSVRSLVQVTYGHLSLFLTFVWRFVPSRLAYLTTNFNPCPFISSIAYNSKKHRILNAIRNAVQEVQKCLCFRINKASPSDWSKWRKGGGGRFFLRFKWESPELPINNFLPAAHTVSCHAFLQTPSTVWPNSRQHDKTFSKWRVICTCMLFKCLLYSTKVSVTGRRMIGWWRMGWSAEGSCRRPV